MKVQSLIQKMKRIGENECDSDMIWYFSKEVEQCLLRVWFTDDIKVIDELYDYPVFRICEGAEHPYVAILGSAETEWAIGLTVDGKIQHARYED